jgi:hypothetical protein
MTATAAAWPVHAPSGLLDALALPPFGARSNGLPATSWVPLLDVAPRVADRLLCAFAVVLVPACAAAPTPRWRPRALTRVWVDVASHSAAEDAVRRLLSHAAPVVADREGDDQP